MNFSYFSEQSKLPLLITPENGNNAKQQLIDWIAANKTTVEEKLTAVSYTHLRAHET